MTKPIAKNKRYYRYQLFFQSFYSQNIENPKDFASGHYNPDIGSLFVFIDAFFVVFHVFLELAALNGFPANGFGAFGFAVQDLPAFVVYLLK
jgi:hypothetical protein